MSDSLYLVLVFLLWYVVGAGILVLLGKYIGPKRISVGRALTAQPLLLTFPLGQAYSILLRDEGIAGEFGQIVLSLVTFYGTWFLLFYVVKSLLGASAPKAILATLAYSIPCAILFITNVPLDAIGGLIPPRTRQAESEIKALLTSMVRYQMKNQKFPIPEDKSGNPIVPVDEHGSAVLLSATGQTRLYYVGPSFVPEILVSTREIRRLPADPYTMGGPGELYRYGSAVIDGTEPICVVSCQGPDRESRAEEIEDRVLREWKGVIPRRNALDDLTYSPTNGLKSSGDIFEILPSRFSLIKR